MFFQLMKRRSQRRRERREKRAKTKSSLTDPGSMTSSEESASQHDVTRLSSEGDNGNTPAPWRVENFLYDGTAPVESDWWVDDKAELVRDSTLDDDDDDDADGSVDDNDTAAVLSSSRWNMDCGALDHQRTRPRLVDSGQNKSAAPGLGAAASFGCGTTSSSSYSSSSSTGKRQRFRNVGYENWRQVQQAWRNTSAGPASSTVNVSSKASSSRTLTVRRSMMRNLTEQRACDLPEPVKLSQMIKAYQTVWRDED